MDEDEISRYYMSTNEGKYFSNDGKTGILMYPFHKYVLLNRHYFPFSHILKERMKQDPSFSQFAEAPDLSTYQNKPV